VRKASLPRRPTVCLLSSHPLVLEEFQHLLLALGFHLRVQRLESNLAPSLGRLRLPRAQICVTDAYAPHQATEMLVAQIQERHPATRQLVVAESFTERSAFALLRLGVKGLLSYAEAREKLPQAVEAVRAGGFWVPRKLLSRFVDWILRAVQHPRSMKGPADLSPREQQVLDALLGNLSNKQIGEELHISERTVKFHVSRLLDKFGVRRRTDLILLWFQNRSSEF
jgi:DNA-binding NarL/FixJ family response regulator